MTVSVNEVVESLHSEQLLDDETAWRATELLASRDEVQPWYIRTMVGVGAWFASLLLISFVAGIGIAATGGYIAIGLALVIAALLMRRQFDNDFMVQATLAASLAGQVLLAGGIVEFGDSQRFEELFMVTVAMSSILFFVFPDRIHRVLMVLFATGSLTILFYKWKLNDLVPALGPTAAAGLVLTHKLKSRIVAAGWGALVRPLMTGLMLSAFGCLMISTFYLMPELQVEFRFYPRPWISAILLGLLLLYVCADSWRPLLSTAPAYATPAVYALLVLIVAAAWAAPGLILALIVVVLGAASGSRPFIGAGIVFLALFLGAYFYGIQVTMLTKSATLVASGVATLLARWLILKMVPASAAGGPDHD